MNDVVTAIRVSQISKSFGGGTRALDNVTVEVVQGRITGLLGRNGAGKSTLIHSILALVRPEAGYCEIFGIPSQDARYRKRVGFLPEEVTYEAGLRLREILALHQYLAACPRTDAREVLKSVGLDVPPSRRI